MRRETPLALYKGLGAVLSGIIPKMAIRFTSFETYKNLLADNQTGKTSLGGIFIGLYAFPFSLSPTLLLISIYGRKQLDLEQAQLRLF